MGEAVYLKTSCLKCGGSVEFPEESENSTVPCPHCGKDLFLYRGVRPVGTPPVLAPVQSANAPALINPIKPTKKGFDLFQKIRSREDALRIIRGVGWLYFVFAVLYLYLGYDFYDPSRFAGSFTTAILAAALCAFNSRIVAIIMLIQICFGAVYQILHAESFMVGGFESVYLLLFIVIAIRAVEATFKFHGKYVAEKLESKPSVKQWVSLVVVGAVALGSVFYFHAIGKFAPAKEAMQSDWNRQENDAMKNGNLTLAVQKILANPNLRNQATTLDPQMVAKTPYNYYGQIGKFTGTVAVVQDYPTGSDNAIAGKESSDIVMVCSDETVVESFCMKSSGNMRVGDTVNLYGYPAGVTDVPNRLGGKDVHLIIIGNDYDDLGIAQ